MSIFNRTRPRSHRRILTIEGGQVVCPRRGLVDIEECWFCPAYRGIVTGVTSGLACATEPITLDSRVRLI